MPAPDPATRITVIVGDDDASAREAGAALAWAEAGRTVVGLAPARHWPFLDRPGAGIPTGPVTFWAPDVHEAFESAQPPHTRLVTTQAHYLFAEWQARLARDEPAQLVATARRDVLERHAPEVLLGRGVFRLVHVQSPPHRDAPAPHTAGGTPPLPPTLSPGRREQAARLAVAFRADTAAARLEGCLHALELGRTAAALLATASVCQEVNDLESAARDLDEAIALEPDWAAAHFERGKVWLRRDDMEAAAGAFRAAADHLPRFGGAWGNLGATLGELDRPQEALAAFERLLALDPASPQAHNNIGVVSRELGRLPESEAAFRRVIELEPRLAFGYYNLGHTLFLQGRYHAAAAAYGQGRSRDPERNPVQATRLALCQLATGDAPGALAELKRASDALPRDYRRQVLADTSAVLWALVTHKPDLDGWQRVHEWLTSELARLA